MYNITLGGDWLNQGSFNARAGTVTLNGVNQMIRGTNTFYNLSKEASSADTLTFEAAKTQTILGTLTLKGSSGAFLSLRSSSPSSQWLINPQATRVVDFLDVQDGNNINLILIDCSVNCINSENNIGFIFPAVSNPPVVIAPPSTDPDPTGGGSTVQETISDLGQHDFAYVNQLVMSLKDTDQGTSTQELEAFLLWALTSSKEYDVLPWSIEFVDAVILKLYNHGFLRDAIICEKRILPYVLSKQIRDHIIVLWRMQYVYELQVGSSAYQQDHIVSTKMLKLDPRKIETSSKLAKANYYFSRLHLQKAQQEFQELIQSTPAILGQKALRGQLVYILALQGKYDQAIEEARLLQKDVPDSKEYSAIIHMLIEAKIKNSAPWSLDFTVNSAQSSITLTPWKLKEVPLTTTNSSSFKPNNFPSTFKPIMF